MSLGFHDVNLRCLEYNNFFFLIHFMAGHTDVSALKFITVKIKWGLLSHRKISLYPSEPKEAPHPTIYFNIEMAAKRLSWDRH
jgi:hypothetical protein